MGSDIETSLRDGVENAERFADKATRSASAEVSGNLKHFKGQVQSTADKLQDVIGQVADQAKAAISNMTEQVNDTYSTASKRAQDIGEVVEPFTKEKPYAALGIAALAGLVIGLIIAGGKPKVVHLRTHT